MKRKQIVQFTSNFIFVWVIVLTVNLVFGDSITWGWGLSDRSHQSYPAVLQTLLGSEYTVKNYGTSGCTMLKQGDKT